MAPFSVQPNRRRWTRGVFVSAGRALTGWWGQLKTWTCKPKTICHKMHGNKRNTKSEFLPQMQHKELINRGHNCIESFRSWGQKFNLFCEEHDVPFVVWKWLVSPRFRLCSLCHLLDMILWLSILSGTTSSSSLVADFVIFEGDEPAVEK